MQFFIFVLMIFLLSPASAAAPAAQKTGPSTPPPKEEETPRLKGGLFSGHLNAEDAQKQAQEGAAAASGGMADARAQVVSLDVALAAYAKGDFQVAYRGFYPLARKGNAGAQETVGVMFLNGQGQEPNEEEAARWFTKAANQGRPLAQHYLGVMYENGQGVEQDSIQALMWLELAIAGYPAGANRERAIQDRDNIALQLTANQQARARAMVAEWKKDYAPSAAPDTANTPKEESK